MYRRTKILLAFSGATYLKFNYLGDDPMRTFKNDWPILMFYIALWAIPLFLGYITGGRFGTFLWSVGVTVLLIEFVIAVFFGDRLPPSREPKTTSSR